MAVSYSYYEQILQIYLKKPCKTKVQELEYCHPNLNHLLGLLSYYQVPTISTKRDLKAFVVKVQALCLQQQTNVLKGSCTADMFKHNMDS